MSEPEKSSAEKKPANYQQQIAAYAKKVTSQFAKNQAFRFKSESSISLTAFSKDEKWLAAASHGSIQIYNMEEKELLYNKETDMMSSISALEFSNDGVHLVAGSYEGQLTMWRTQDMKVISKVENGHNGKVVGIKHGQQDGIIYTISDDGSVNVFETKSNRSTRLFKSSIDECQCFALSSNNKYFAIAGTSGIEIWENEKICKMIHCFKNAHQKPIKCIFFANNDRNICSGSENIKVWDIKTKERVDVYDLSDYGKVNDVIFLAKKAQLIVGTDSGKVIFFSIKTRRVLFALERIHESEILNVYLSAQNTKLISTSKDKSMRVWNIDRQVMKPSINITFQKQQSATASALSPNGIFLAIGGSLGQIFVYNTELNLQAKIIDAHKGKIQSLTFGNDSILFSNSIDKTIAISDVKEGTVIRTINCETNVVAPIDKGDGVLAVSKQLKYFTVQDKPISPKKQTKKEGEGEEGNEEEIQRKLDGKIPHEVEDIIHLKQNGETEIVLSGTENRTIFVQDIVTSTEIAALYNAHSEKITCVRLFEDKETLISGGQVLKVWNLNRRNLLFKIQSKNNSEIVGIDLVHDERFAVVGRQNGEIEIYDLILKRLIHTYRENISKHISSTFLSPEGDTIYAVSSGNDKKVFRLTNIIHDLTLPIVSLGHDHEIDMQSRLPIFVLDRFLDTRDNDHRGGIIKNFSDLVVYPFNWNFLHLSAIYFPDIPNIKDCINSNVKMAIDCDNRTILHHFLKKEHLNYDLMNFLFKNFEQLLPSKEKESYGRYLIIEQCSNIFFTLISFNNPSVVNFLIQCIDRPPSLKGVEAPQYGKIRHHRGGKSTTKYIQMDEPFLTREIRDHNIKNHPNQISVQLMRIKLDWNIDSVDMSALAYILSTSKADEVFKTQVVGMLIQYMWNKTKIYHIIHGLLYTVFMILMSVYMGQRGEKESEPIGIAALVFGMYFFLLEFPQMYFFGLIEYFNDAWNLLDAARSILLLTSFIYNFTALDTNPAGLPDSTQDTKNWLFSLALILGYMRWASQFRYFHQFRTLLKLIVHIFEDMFSFLIIIVMIVFGFAIVFMQFDQESTLGDQMLIIYQDMFGEMTTDDYETAEFFYWVIVTILLTLVLMNMIIAIMGETYSRIQANQTIVDSKERLNLILEAMIFNRTKKGIKNLLTCQPCRKHKKTVESSKIGPSGNEVYQSSGGNSNKHYLLYIGEHGDDELHQYDQTKWEGRYAKIENIFEEAIAKNNNSIRREQMALVNEMTRMREELKYFVVEENKKIARQLKGQKIETVDMTGQDVVGRTYTVTTSKVQSPPQEMAMRSRPPNQQPPQPHEDEGNDLHATKRNPTNRIDMKDIAESDLPIDRSRQYSDFGSNNEGPEQRDVSEIQNEGTEGSKAWQFMRTEQQEDNMVLDRFVPKRSNFLDQFN